MIRGICCILLAVAMFAPVARKIYKWNNFSKEEWTVATADVVDPWSCRPEPAERKAYMLGCLLAPLLLVGLTFLSRRIGTPAWNCPRWLQRAAQLGIVGVAAVYAWWMLGGDQCYQLAGILFHERPWAALPVLLVAAPAAWWLNGDSRAARWSGHALVALPVVGLALFNWLGQNDAYTAGTNHFPAVFDPVAQVCLGKNLLADFGTQYGLYADFLAPLFSVIGLSVTKFTFVMSLLAACSFGVLWFVLTQVVQRRGIAIFGLAAMLFDVWLMFQVRTVECYVDFFDPYYQYLPLRFIFPAAAIALTWIYHQRRSPTVYWATHVILAVGLLWNFDSGFVAQACWLATLLFDALYENTWGSRVRRGGAHVAATVVVTVAVTAGYSLAKFACYGLWPDFTHLLDYQGLFYVSGFYMLPMHFRGAWQLVVLVYLAGLAFSAAALAAGERGPKPTLIFMVSLLGLGLFSYYQGRSHNQCLILCWWPALFLLPIFVDELLERADQHGPVLCHGLAAMLCWFMVGSAVSLGTHAPFVWQMTSGELAKDVSSDARFAAEARLLDERVGADEGVLILSAYAPIMETKAQRSSLAPASLVQMLWVSQYQRLVDSLEERAHSWVFVDREYDEQFFVSPQTNPGSKLLMDAISTRLHKVAETSRGTLYEFYGAKATAGARPDHRAVAQAELSDAEDGFQISADAFQFVRGLPRYAAGSP